MSTLRLQLNEAGRLLRTLAMPAASVVETTLTVTPERISLPTLISAETIIGRINDAGFELASGDDVDSITRLINTYYLPTASGSWGDKTLDVNVVAISPDDIEVYDEIRQIRSEVIQSARDVVHYESKNDYTRAKKAEDRAIRRIEQSAKRKPAWWARISRLLLKTAISTLFEALVGIPLAILVRSVLGHYFDHDYL